MRKRAAGDDGLEVTGSQGAYEEAIRQIREVLAVRLVADPRGEISEIHVLAGSGRNPKQIVRDIESSLMAQFGLSVDHKKISVAQVDDTGPVSWGTGRAHLLGVRFTVDGIMAEAEVKVEFDDVVHSATVSGPASAANRLRAVAQATLTAIGEYFNSQSQICLDDVAVFELRGRRIIITVLSLMAPGGEEVLTGSSLVRAGEAEAVAKAVLDAMNRRFSLIVRKPLNRRGPDDPEPCQER